MILKSEVNQTSLTPEILERLRDQIAVDGAFQRLNHLWKIHGLKALTPLYAPPHSRAEFMGMEYAEIERVISRIKTFYSDGIGHDWIAEWNRAGDEYLERAREAAARGRRETAGDMYLIATAGYFCGAFCVFGFEELPPREAIHRRAVETYKEGAQYFRPPARRVDIAFEGGFIPGYLRLPEGVKRPPCTLMVGGANSTKEDNHPIADYFLQRGMAVFLFDGPGQGEYLQSTGKHLRVRDYDRAVKAAVDWVIADGCVDPDRLGIFGKSTGGLLVLHAAASEHRLKAVVCHPGSFHWEPDWNELTHPFYPRQVEMAHMLGARSREETKRIVTEELSLMDVLDDVHVPVLCVNGKDEWMSFPTQVVELQKRAKFPIEVVYYPGTAHGGIAVLAYPLEADWMREKLTQ